MSRQAATIKQSNAIPMDRQQGRRKILPPGKKDLNPNDLAQHDMLGDFLLLTHSMKYVAQWRGELPFVR
jgi:hypothetical protein